MVLYLNNKYQKGIKRHMKTNIKQRIGALATTVAILGVVVSPAIASAATDDTDVEVVVGSSISVSTNTTVSISLTPTSNGTLSSAKDTVTVSTNNTAGYNLTLKDSDSTTDLTSGGNSFTAADATPAALTAGKWGFALASGTTGIGVAGFDASYSAVTNVTGATSKWSGIAATPVTIKSTTTTATNDTTDVYYAAMADTNQPNGTYTDTVTYTATTN